MSNLEIYAVVVAFLGIWFTSKRWLICWPTNLLASGLYFKIFYDVRLYADMTLQLLFGVMILYGWLVWSRRKADDGEILVRPLPRRQALFGLIIGAIGGIVLGWLISRFTDGALPWMDAALTSFSLIAQFWTARRHAESWLLWIVVDIFYVAMFVMKDLWLTAGLYSAMIILAINGYRQWRIAKPA